MNEQKPKLRYNYDLLKKYGDENDIKLLGDYSDCKVVRDTIINEKCLECDEIFSKSFRGFIKSGCFCKIHTLKNAQAKKKETCLKRYGCEYPSQSEEVRERIKATNVEKYGCEYPFQSEEVRERIKATNVEKYGCENPFQSEEVRERIKATNVEKYGCENPSQSEKIKAKKMETTFKNYGYEHPLQSEEVKERIKATNVEKYGYEHPMQNAEVSEKASKNAFKSYYYIFPSGRKEKIQGYENHTLNDLLKEGISEDDIVINRDKVPEAWYEDITGKRRRYFVDCFIKSQNRCVETKSPWTAERQEDSIYLKQQALKDLGYECEIRIYNKMGELLEKIL